jgi:Fic family protein
MSFDRPVHASHTFSRFFFQRNQSDTLSDRHDVELVMTLIAVHVEFAAIHPLAGEIPAGHDGGMSQVAAQ